MLAMTSIPEGALLRFDGAPDEEPCQAPRLGPHFDETALAIVTEQYRRHFRPGGAILDLTSSGVSHLPPEIDYRRVVGVGLNAAELAENPFLDEWRVHDLNRDPRLPFADGEFDGAAICVAMRHLTRPVEVLREVGRVLRPGAPLVIAFSSRCFPGEGGHVRLVHQMLEEAGNWLDVACCNCCLTRDGEPLYAVIARSAGPARGRSELPAFRPAQGSLAQES
jgi:SAM-dependent methyltransferase